MRDKSDVKYVETRRSDIGGTFRRHRSILLGINNDLSCEVVHEDYEVNYFYLGNYIAVHIYEGNWKYLDFPTEIESEVE